MGVPREYRRLTFLATKIGGYFRSKNGKSPKQELAEQMAVATDIANQAGRASEAKDKATNGI